MSRIYYDFLQKKKRGGWNCPRCRFRNSPTSPVCTKCPALRPESYDIPLHCREEAHAVASNYAEWMRADDLPIIKNKEHFSCPICFDDIEPGDGIELRECLHTFCRECLHDAVKHSEEAELKCPFQDDDHSCEAILQEREIRALVPEDLFLKYQQRSLDEAEAKEENSFHCKTADCQGWCVYDEGVECFQCPVCLKDNCLICKAIHEQMTCKEFQKYLEEKKQRDNNEKLSEQALQAMLDRKEAMKCPGCQVPMEKESGCDWLLCSRCKTEICWATKGPRWGPGGTGDISGGCKCGVRGQKCAPNCQNCH